MSNTLYHGTKESFSRDILTNGIDVGINPRGCDFGVGFYLSPSINCAKQWALRRAFGVEQPSIVELTLKKGYKNIVQVKDFGEISLDSSDEKIIEWAQFVINNRNGIDYVKKVAKKNGYENNNLDKRYDLVIGTIADGDVTKIARKCSSDGRVITIEEARRLLDKSYGLQYCICTEKGLGAIDKKPRLAKGVSWR